MRAVLNRIYQQDCLAGMEELLDPGEVDVIVTSPPYNIGVRYRRYRDRLPRGEYLDWMERLARACKRVLAEDGSLFLNLGYTPSDPWIAWEVAARFREYLTLQNVIHWVKSIAIEKADVGNYPGICGDVAVGHYRPVGGERFLHQCHEYVFHFTHRGDIRLDRLAVGVPYQDKSNVRRWKSVGGDLRCRGNVWFIPYRTIHSRKDQRPHPSTFPEKLPEMCIRLHGVQRVRLVLDPFMGIGTTALACVRLGVPFLGFEIDEDYIQEANRRLAALGLRASE